MARKFFYVCAGMLMLALCCQPGTSAAQTCPVDVVRLGMGTPGPTSFTVPALDTTRVDGLWDCSQDCCNEPSCGGSTQYIARIAYDWRTGAFRADASMFAGIAGGSFLDAADVFVVHGASGPVTVRARLAVHADGYGAFGDATSSVLATLQSANGPGAADSRICYDDPCSFDMVLETSLAVDPGVPFTLGVLLHASAGCNSCFNYGASVSSQATLTFADLPPGASISSCKGYAPVATRTVPASWGQLKARYR